MSGEAPSVALAAELQPPMENGEVVFAEPWQGRIFGMAVALHDAGCFSWPEFQKSLIAVIAQWDSLHDEDDDQDVYEYYEHFEKALLNILQAKEIVAGSELLLRSRAYAERAHGHDH